MSTATPRINMLKHWPEGYTAMRHLNQTVHDAGLDPKLIELIKIRASQLNKCAYCINMHVADARKLGETEQRLALLPAFEEAGCYTESEKAVLSLTEALTLLPAAGVPDAIVARLRAHFDDTQITKLVFAGVVINAWNRIGVADHLPFAVQPTPVAQTA